MWLSKKQRTGNGSYNDDTDTGNHVVEETAQQQGQQQEQPYESSPAQSGSKEALDVSFFIPKQHKSIESLSKDTCPSKSTI